jgi:hypothetical protein
MSWSPLVVALLLLLLLLLALLLLLLQLALRSTLTASTNPNTWAKFAPYITNQGRHAPSSS